MAMAQQLASVLALAAAVLLIGGCSFAVAPGMSPRGAQLRGAGQQGIMRGSAWQVASEPSSVAAGVPLAAACLTVAAACTLVLQRGGKRHAGRTATHAKVTTEDSQGRMRFAVPMAAMVPSEQPGNTKPLGFFDPLGFSMGQTITFKNDPTGFRHMRAAEIKHGRVCMMGSLGSVAAHYWKFPGFEDVPSGLAALNTDLGAKGFAILVILVGTIEAASWKESTDEPGSYGDPLNLGNYSLDMRNREINNSRMAMFAMAGQIAAELATGKDPVAQFGL